MRSKKRKKRLGIILVIIALVVLISVGLYIADYYNLIPKKYYTAEDFNITSVYSAVDYNNNGYDDYTDLLIGARIDAKRPEAYTNIERPDSNIDFRRVVNLHVFFKEYGISLTTDINQIEEWQAGDIVVFANDKHIGIVSDKRNSDGHAYIIHNGGQPNREEDILYRSEIIGHYRFDASKLSEGLFVKWSD